MGFDIAGLGDGTAGGVAFRDEEGGLEALLVLCVEMGAAVAEFAVVDLGLFCALTGDLFNTLQFLALAFSLLDTGQ